jgi:hypothetical protein
LSLRFWKPLAPAGGEVVACFQACCSWVR